VHHSERNQTNDGERYIQCKCCQRATLGTAANTEQESINAVGVDVGKNPAFGVALADDVTIRKETMPLS
jgi:hypothetical protein